MKEYKREYPQFSLCGLNCGLCPRYQTSGASKCPGCGGVDFHLKHPTCAVITCNSKHDNVEYCFQCSAYPCEKYRKLSEKDSFISYRNVIDDFEKAKKNGIDCYKEQLNEKIGILELLLENYDDGRHKGFYCRAANLLLLSDLRDVIAEIENTIGKSSAPLPEKIQLIVLSLEVKAVSRNSSLELRK